MWICTHTQRSLCTFLHRRCGSPAILHSGSPILPVEEMGVDWAHQPTHLCGEGVPTHLWSSLWCGPHVQPLLGADTPWSGLKGGCNDRATLCSVKPGFPVHSLYFCDLSWFFCTSFPSNAPILPLSPFNLNVGHLGHLPFQNCLHWQISH